MKQSLFNEIEAFSLYGAHADRFEYIACGKDGDVYARDKLVIKVFKADGKSRDDGMKLHMLDKSIYYPQVHLFTNDFMVSDRIIGETFYQLEGHDNNLRKRFENEIQQAVYDAELVGLSAFDLHNHNLMLTEDGEIRIVDVGRFGVGTDTLHCGLFSWFNSSRRRRKKHKRHDRHSSSSRHHYRHSSSSRRHHHHRHSHSSSFSS